MDSAMVLVQSKPMPEASSSASARGEALDQAGLRSSLERHHAESFGWAMHCCDRRRDLAENALQAAYLQVLSGRARFEGRSAFKTWLFSVIRRTAAAERRGEFLRRFRLAAIPREFAQFSRVEATDRDERCDGLEAALRALPARQREVLHLVFYQEISIAEAAAIMGVSVGSARTHYERAKQRIRQVLEKRQS